MIVLLPNNKQGAAAMETNKVAFPKTEVSKKPQLSKYLFIAFFLISMVLVVFYVWNEQNKVNRGGDGPLYHNLMDYPAYIKRGFDPADTVKIPSENSRDWVLMETSPPRVSDSKLPDLPKRSFLSPLGREAEEFTIVIPLEIDSGAVSFINHNRSILPGIFFAGIGENWEVYFNGVLVRSEKHLDETGKIRERRTWRDVYFPMDNSLLVSGTNILALRILGDPTYRATGLTYNAPHYMDDYSIIEGRQKNFTLVVLCGIFGFTGIYHLMLFFSVKRKPNTFYLYYSIFSIMLCGYSVAGSGMVNTLITNSDISIRLEYISLIVSFTALCLFIETLGRPKITKVSMGFAGFSLISSVSLIFSCAQFCEELIRVWTVTGVVFYSYVLFYDIVYLYFFDKARKRDSDSGKVNNAPIINIMIGLFGILFCAVYDVLDILFFHNSFGLFQYSTFVFHIGMAFALSQRFSGIYKRLEQSYVILETAVEKRTVELEEQTRIAIEASRAKSKFLATMSHEIRTPLNAIIGLSEIELRGSLPDSSRNNITQIHHSGSTLLGIINDILDISKIEAGALEFIPDVYNTATFISDTVNLNRVRIASKPINFVLEIEGDYPGKLRGDELRVKQALNNLLSNAIKYTNEGTVTFSAAWKKTSANEALLRFSVKDTGVGIRKEDTGKLFSCYSQLDVTAHRQIEGTGLGLEITKKLVEMMGGNITVESEYGKGSVFTVELIQGLEDSMPIGEETAKNLRNFCYSESEREIDIERSWMPFGKVLVVDDMPVNLQVAIGLLEPYGLKVDIASSGKEAIELVKEKNSNGDGGYNLIFMDQMMPEMDGIETVKIIREWEKEQGNEFKQIPVIALTANALVGNMEMLLSRGFNGFISKPIDIVQFDNELNKWIRDKQTPETLRQTEKREKVTASKEQETPVITIPGVDVKHGITMTGGREALYFKVLAILCRDAENRLPMLRTVPDSETLPAFTTQVHAFKSASATIGAAEVSSLAEELETAGRAGNLALIGEKLPVFAERL